MHLKELKVCYLLLWITILHDLCNACSFYSTKDYPQDSESGKFIRIKENHKVGDEILLLDVYPRKSISLRGMDRTADDKYFRIREINTTTIQIVLSKSLDDLVDNDVPQNILKFKLQCNTLVTNSNDMSFLTVTVYIEDINDNKPVFLNTPYAISIDESIPVGSIVFQGINAFDRDKPNTPNSDVQYFIGHQTTDLGGPYFMLDSPHRPNVILKRPLDYDEGLKQFDLEIIARDRGTPQQQSNTTLTIFIEDVDDLPPAFTHNVYHTKVKEFFTVTGKNIHKQLKIDPPVKALDQDSLNSTLIYSIISGNEKNNFWINPNDGMIFLKREIDLEEERLPENKYRLQLEVRQKNDHSKRASALLEIEIVDINDNLPEFEVDLYNISIVENLPNGFSVLQVNAIDRDQGENAEFLYKIHKEDPPGAFTVDPRTGWMTVKNQTLLDREERSSVKILIQAVEKVKQYDRKNGELSTVAVEITLLDANDNTPTFEMGNLYEFKVDVNSTLGHVIGQIKAFDPDEGPNGKIVYEIKNRKDSSLVPFKLDRRTGVLTVNGHLHRGRIALFIEASDEPVNPSERRYSLAVLTLDIINKNDNGEIKFMGAPYEFWIGSNAPIGTSVGQVRTVYNSDVHDEIIYDLLHSYSEGVPFAIEEQSGIITVIRPINSFDRIRYNFEAVATYAHNPIEHVKNQTRQVRRKSSPEDLGFQVDEGVVSDLDLEHMYIANVTINVVNPNNKEKIFVKGTRNKLVEFHVKENQANIFIGSLLGKNVMDISKLNNTLSSNHPTSLKRRTKPRENRQMMNSSKFRKPADAKKNSTNSMGGLEMPRILNRNAKMVDFELRNTTRRMSIHEKYGRVYNLPPITLKQNISNLIKRNSNVAKYIRNRNRYQRAVPDGEINFIIANDHDVKDKIYISNEGNLMTASELDREENEFFKISVIAEYSHGPVATTGIYQINIIVDDENDNPPRFDHNSYVGIIAENSPLGTEVFLNNPIIARDADAGKNAEFTISIMGDGNRLFTIEKSDSTTNDVVKKQTFQNLNTTSLSMFSDSVLDEYSSMIDKKLMNLHFMLMSSDDRVTTNQTNYVIKFVGPITLDRERKNFYRLRLVAKDSGGLTSEAQLMVFITDVNDNPPMFEKLAVFKNTGIEIIQYSDKMEIYFVDDNLEARTSEIETVFATALETTTQRNRRNVTRFNIREKFAEASNKAPVRIRYRKPIGTPRGYAEDEDDLFLSRNYKEGNFNEKYPIFAIEENVQPGITLLQFTATDEDYGNNAQITYEILEETVVPIKFTRQNLTGLQNFFSIDRISGELKTNRQLIPQIEIKLIIVAKDNANLKDEVLIGIRVVDVNNNAPIFKRTFYSFDIEEGFHINKILGSIEATDDDYEDNANITYHVVSEGSEKFPFSVTSNTGIVKVSGDLDRELKGVYAFKIMAQDNSKNYPILNSTVEIEVNIIDKNDNIPQFIGFDELMINEIPTSEDIGRKLSRVDKDDLHLEDEELVVQNRTPVYKIQISRHIRPRRFIKQIQAVDPDFAGNGNGLVMYGIKHSNVSFLFDIDAREGIVTTTSSWEQLQVMNEFDFINLTIVASDLGNPVMTSYALLLINLDGDRNTTTTSTTTTTTTTTTTERMTVPTKPPPVFYQHHQYYEIEVLENNQTPMKLLKLNTSNDYNLYRWSLVEEDDLPDDLFDIEDGTLWLKQALDREERDIYQLKVRADVISSLTLPMQRGRSAKKIQMMYPVNDDRISNLSENEVRVVIKILDENDNTPTFKDNGQPIIAVLPSTASYGYNVYRVEATDLDTGINAEIRYSLINEVTNLFTIDSVTGQIRTIGNQIWRSNQRVFGLDILAKDRRGADDGKSSIVNMLVYVLDETKQVRFIMSGNAADIEKDIDRISESLSDASGLIVRINMLEPNMEDMNAMTNLYIYAIDPKTNALVDMEELQDIMSEINMENFKPSLPIVELAKFGSSSNYYPKIARPNESTAHSNGGELASIVLSITILVGGLATAVCLVCVRYKRMQLNNAIAPLNAQHINRQHLFHQRPPSIDCDYSTTTTSASQSASPTDNRPSSLYAAVPKGIVKTRKNNLIHENREYIDVPLPQSVLAINMQQDHHESNCSRYNFLLHNNKSTKNNIIKEHYESNECICRDRLDEENSSVSYEDSLKDFPIEETTTTSKTTTMISLQPQQQGLQHIQHQRTSFRQKILNNLDRASNRHSFSGFHSIQRMKNSRRSSFVVNKTNPIGIIRQ